MSREGRGMTTDEMRPVASKHRTAITLGIAGLTVGAAFATVYLVGPITPEQSAHLNVAFGVLDGGTVGLHRCLQRRPVRAELIVLLARDQFPVHEIAVPAFLHLRVLELGEVALEIGLRLLHLGLALAQRRLGLTQRRLEGPRIDDEEKIVPADILPLLEAHLHDLPVHLRLDADRREGLRVADRRELDRHGPLDDIADRHGHERHLDAGLPGSVVRAPGEEQDAGQRLGAGGGQASADHFLALRARPGCASSSGTPAAASTSASNPVSTWRRSSADIRARTRSMPRRRIVSSSSTT